MTQAISSIQDFYEKWCTAWRTLDIELMLSLFDLESGDLAYQSEENEGPLVTGEALTSYWNRATELIKEVPAWEPLTNKFAVIGDSAFVYTKLQTSLLTTLFPEPFEGELRVTLGLIKRGEGWRIIQYHESRQLDLAKEMGFALDA